MGCKECGKPKCNGECGCKSPKVLQINNPAEYITFHKVSIPAAMGDSTTNPPKIGAYRNALVYYEADHTSWMYSTDGIPTLVTGEHGDQGPQGEPGPQGYMNEQDVRDVVDTIVPEGFFSEPATETDCGSPIITGNEEPKEIANIVFKNEANATIYGEHEIVRCGKNLLSNKIAGSISWSGSVVTFSGSEIKVSKTGTGGISANPHTSTVYYPIKQGDKLTFTMKYRQGTINSDGKYAWTFNIYGVRADGTADVNSRLIAVSIPYNTTTPSAVSATGTSNSDYIGFSLGTYIAGNTPTTSGDVYFDCQLETGETATAIEPYSETRYPLSLFNSKNLIDPTPLGSGTLNGIGYSVSSDGTINISGTASANTHIIFPITIPSYYIGENAVFSYTGTFSTIGNINIKRRTVANYWGSLTSSTTYSSEEITEERYNNADTVDIYIPNGRVVSAAIKLQLEIGASATEYEQFSPINLDAGDRFEKINNVWNVYDSSDDSYSRVTNARLISQLYALDGLNYSSGYNTIFDSTQYDLISPCISYYGDGYYATIAQLESADSDRVYRSSNISTMANTDIPENSLVETAGCMTPGDGGNALYIVQSTNETADGYAIVDMQNGMQARLLPQNGKVNVRQFGAAGDGVTDDTAVINNAITYCQQADIHELVVPDGVFVISGTLTIDSSNFALKGSANSMLKFIGDGTGTASNALNLIEIVGTNADDYIENITIENIKIDGTSQVYKGGYSMDDPTATNTNPGYRGLVCVKADFCKNVKIEGCLFNDIYGEGIIMRYCADVNIDNNHLYDVSSGNIDQNGQTGWDDHGDCIATFFSYNVSICENTVINRRTYQAGTAAAIGKQCGRSGLEFEYAINQDAPAADPNDPTKNAPGYSDIQTELVDGKNVRYGVGLRMLNNYVYGFTKGIHLESRIKCIINDNTVLYNHVGVMASIHNFTSFSGNYFNPMGVGAAPQSGYDGYYGGIAISEYSSNERRFGIVISNNTFDGEGKGVTVASNYVTIIGNRFDGDIGIYTQKTNLRGINISNNTFNNTFAENFEEFVFLYNVLSGRIVGNSFFGNTFNKLLISGDNIVISENEFVNTAINHNNGGNHLTIRDNLFRGNLFTDIVLKVAYGHNSLIDNNNFDIEDFNTDGKVVAHFTGSTTNSVFSNNKFSVTTTRSDLQIVRFETIEKVKILNNSFLTDANVDFIRMYTSKSCEFRNNKVANVLALVFHHYGGFGGCTVYENNIGVLDGIGYKPNNSLSVLVNQFYNLSQKIYKYNIDSSATKIGWICTSAGYYVTQVWETGSIDANKLVKNASDHVYKCITKGSGDSTVEPTHTTFANVTESDGYEWQYLGSVATFSELTI